MYCPRCSQQQIAGTRFCPGCGLQLDFVSELLANNGIPSTNVPTTQKDTPFLQRKGVRPGAKLIFLSLFIFPLSLLASIPLDSPFPLFIPLIIFMLGLAKVTYTLVFGEQDQLEQAKSRAASLMSNRMPLTLPASRNPARPIEDSQRIQTAEMVGRPSVTEHTTRLLDDEQR